jgi:hypothetical protein
MAEAWLDRFFARDYRIAAASEEEQRQGIDRWFCRNGCRRTLPVDYKTDWKAAKSGNAYLETTSVDMTGKRGWAYTSRAEVLVYFVPGLDVIYLLKMLLVRRELPRWLREYGPPLPAKNEGYCTWGVCVPLREFERFAFEVLNLADLVGVPPLPEFD